MIGQNGNQENYNYLYHMQSTIVNKLRSSVNLKNRHLHIVTFQHLDEHYLRNKDRNLFFEIYWVTHEKPLSFLEKELIPIQGDRMHLIPPSRNYLFDKSNKNGVLIAFHKDLLTYEAKEFSLSVYSLFARHGEFSSLLIDQETITTFESILSLLEAENSQNPDNILLLRTLLKAFLLKLMNGIQHQLISPGINEKRIYHFLLLLEDHYITQKNVDFYAEKLNLSPKRLNQILKQKTGKTINQILQERTLTEAKHLLFAGKKNIREIAYALGFQDASYFSRFFKKMTRLTPEAFRAKTNSQFNFRKS